MQLILLLVAAWLALRPRGGEVAAAPVSYAPPAGSVLPTEGVTVADPVATAHALEQYTPNTPIVWVGPDGVTRETTVAQLAMDLRAASLMNDSSFLPPEAIRIGRPPGTSQVFAL